MLELQNNLYQHTGWSGYVLMWQTYQHLLLLDLARLKKIMHISALQVPRFTTNILKGKKKDYYYKKGGERCGSSDCQCTLQEPAPLWDVTHKGDSPKEGTEVTQSPKLEL